MTVLPVLSELPELLTRQNVADLCQVDIRTVHRWEAAGRIPKPFKLGRSTRWRKEAIGQFLSERAQTGR